MITPPARNHPWFLKLHWQVVLAMLAGVALGLGGGPGLVHWYEWAGQWFLRGLSVLAVPLVLSAIVAGVARLGDPAQVRRLGLKTLAWYLVTALLAVLTALLAVNLIQPGRGLELDAFREDGAWGYQARVRDVVLDILPFTPPGAERGLTGEGSSTLVGLIFIAFALGLGLATLRRRRRNTALLVFDALFELLMKAMGLLVRLAPLGVLSLLATLLAHSGSWILIPLAGYMGTVALALGIHFFITIPLLVLLGARCNPLVYFRKVQDAPALAFATASSNAALPVSLEVAEQGAGIDTRVAGFVLPLGAMVNLDGAALYEGVAALFIAQAWGYDFGVAEQLLVLLTAQVVSFGAAGIPYASLVMLAVVFRAVGLPLESIGVLFAVDRVLDMWRTATNVWGDLGAAAVVASLEPGGVPGGDTDREWTGDYDLREQRRPPAPEGPRDEGSA